MAWTVPLGQITQLYNPYHHPAGSGKGGQFAPAPEGAGKGLGFGNMKDAKTVARARRELRGDTEVFIAGDSFFGQEEAVNHLVNEYMRQNPDADQKLVRGVAKRYAKKAHRAPDEHYEAGRNADFIHNHPGGDCILSSADLEAARKFNFKRMIVYGRQGVVVITRPKGGWPKSPPPHDAFGSHDDFFREAGAEVTRTTAEEIGLSVGKLKQIAEAAKAQTDLTPEEAFEQLLEGMARTDRMIEIALGDLIELAGSYEESYHSSLRSAVRGLWKGELDYDLFFDSMLSAIQMFLPKAGYEGAAEVGVSPADLSPEEKTIIEQTVSRETNYIDGLAQAVEQNREAGGKLGTLFNRVELWVKRYNDLRNRIKALAGGDQKMEWVLNPEKENCPSCQKLNGKVKRASYWERVDVRPQHPTKLECMISAGGVSVCGCEFRPTDLPCTPGPLPNLP